MGVILHSFNEGYTIKALRVRARDRVRDRVRARVRARVRQGVHNQGKALLCLNKNEKSCAHHTI